MKMFLKFRKWWLFGIANPVVRKGEAGAFKWIFRRYWLEIETLSGNFKVKFTAAEYPYGYLLAGNDDQTHGFAQRLYEIGMLMCTEQRFVNDLDKALKSYSKRLNALAKEAANDPSDSEEAALEFEKQVQEAVEMPKKERRKMERDADRLFKKAMKEAENGKK